MNQQMIAFHSRIQAWGERPVHEKTSGYEQGMHLSAQKYSQIETWRKEVNRNFQQSSRSLKFPSFMRLSAPTYQISRPKTSGVGYKSRSADPRVKSARAHLRLLEGNLTTVATRLADISSHYANNRKELHQNQPLLIKSMTTLNSDYRTADDITSGEELSLDGRKQNPNYSNTVSPRTTFKAKQQTVNDVVACESHEKNQIQDGGNIESYIEKTDLSDSIINLKNSEDKICDQSQVEKSDSNSSIYISSDLDMSESESSMASSEESPKLVPEMRVANRSTSNNLLNVLSIDDCKIACRYRPCIVKEKHNGMNYEWLNKKDRGEEEFVERKVKNSTSSLTPSGESYGRNTVMYSKTESSSAHPPKKSARIRLKSAMDTLIKDRRATNKGDSPRTGIYGQPISDQHEGSATFRRLNATLRKHITDMMEEKNHERRRVYEERKKKYKMENSDAKLISEELRKI